MIFNLKDIDMNNYVSWVYSELLKKIQTAETTISEKSEDIYRINGFVGFDGQLMYSLNLANEQIPEGSNLNDYIMTGTYYCTGTSVATTIANRFPKNGEYGVFYGNGKAYIRQYVECGNGYVLKSLHNQSDDMTFKRMNEIEYIGTCCDVVRT